MSLTELQVRRIHDGVFAIASAAPECCDDESVVCALCSESYPMWRVDWKRTRNEIFSQTPAPPACLVCHRCFPLPKVARLLSPEQIEQAREYINIRRYDSLYRPLLKLAKLGDDEAHYYSVRISGGDHLDPDDLRRAWALLREKNIWGLVA